MNTLKGLLAATMALVSISAMPQTADPTSTTLECQRDNTPLGPPYVAIVIFRSNPSAFLSYRTFIDGKAQTAENYPGASQKNTHQVPLITSTMIQFCKVEPLGKVCHQIDRLSGRIASAVTLNSGGQSLNSGVGSCQLASSTNRKF